MAELLESRAGPRWSVLDLGSSSNHNLGFFAATRARYAVEELFASLAPCRTGGRVDSRCVASLPDLFSYPEGTRFDAVLAWDILNYLEPEVIQALVPRLVPWLRPGALIHVLISREGRIAAQPRPYELSRRDRVRQGPPKGGGTIPSPRYVQPTLERCIAPLRVQKGYLLKLGLQEFLLELPQGPRPGLWSAGPGPPGS
jgi:hypothetical protein